MPLNKSIPVPLYYQLAEKIKERIDTGELKPGDQLPSERETAEQADVSRMTARQAVTYLVRQGILEVKQGVGTFVVQPKLTHDSLHLLGFTEEMIQKGWPVRSRVLEQAVVSPPSRVVSGLGLRAGETTVKIIRLRLSQDLPLLLETIFIPTTLCPGLEKQDLMTQSLYALLERQCGLHAVHSRQTLESTSANEYEAELFGIVPGTAVILLEGVTYLEQDRPLEFFKAVYRGDRFKFELESYHDNLSQNVLATQRVNLSLGLK